MKRSGFSLVELLVVLAIMAILATIAIPSYSRYIAIENIKRAQSDLEFLSERLEYRYQRVLAHPTSEYETTAALEAAIPGWTPTSNPDEFNFSNEDAATTGYTIIATGLTGLTKNCTVSLSQDGIKTVSNCGDLTVNEQWL